MKCNQYLLIAWNPKELLAFTFNEDNICVASTAETKDYKDKDYVVGAMYSIMRYKDGTEILNTSANGYPYIQIVKPEPLY